ncbi:hypothetical protein Spb1_22090 [Planctopirus ephydatiae]|uniref:BON domain protein n=1 Tax=Planctopirus ephydatiae TaxID=2528019 RepID=A0A518GNS3_9PLAN|nr:BON domain-containing protein [Planctopirus ephydatiae]QDV30280.1 hypothetical protein Spb1_22090 [Planctopirus ephydatiae]
MIVAPTRAERHTKRNPEPRFAPSQPINSTWDRGAPSPSIDDDGMGLVVERHLQMSNYGPVRAVRCSVVNGVVTLFGTLPSYYMKQVAQTLVCRGELVFRVENLCEVVYPQQRDSSPTPSCGSEADEPRSSTKGRLGHDVGVQEGSSKNASR